MFELFFFMLICYAVVCAVGGLWKSVSRELTFRRAEKIANRR